LYGENEDKEKQECFNSKLVQFLCPQFKIIKEKQELKKNY